MIIACEQSDEQANNENESSNRYSKQVNISGAYATWFMR